MGGIALSLERMVADAGSTSEPSPRTWPVHLGWGLITLSALAHVAYYFPRVVDDLFISLRYAEP
jgi:hypothetical protein